MNKNLLIAGKYNLLVILFCVVGLLAACGKDYTDIEHVQRAKDFQDSQQYDAVIIELKNALSKNPENVEARWMLGLAYLDQRAGSNAEKELSRAQQLGIDPDLVEPKLARALLLEGKFTELIDNYPVRGRSEASTAEILALRGRALVALGKADQARDSLDKALKIQKNNVDAMLGLASLESMAEHDKEAGELLEQVLSEDPRNIEALNSAAKAKFLQLDYEGAEKAYEELLALHPGNFQGILGLAKSQFALGKESEALQKLERLRKADSNAPEPNYLRARILLKQQNIEGAIENLQLVLRVLPDHLQSHLLMGAAQYSKGNLNSARSYLARFVENASANVQANNLYASTLLRLGEAEQAISVLLRSDKIAPNDAQTLTLLAKAHEDTGELARSKEYYEQALAINPNASELYSQMAIGELRDGKPADAIAYLQQTLVGDPDNTQAELLLSTAYLRDGDKQLALESAQKLIERKPDNPVGYNMLAAVYMSTGQLEEARQSLEKALQVRPGDAGSALNLARLALRTGETAGAKEYFEYVLKYDPDHASALLGLASLSALAKDQEKAVDLVQRAWSQNPGHLQAGQALIEIYVEQKKYLRALGIAQELYKKHETNPGVLKTLGMVHLASGDPANALLDFERLAKLQAGAPEPHLYLAQAYLRMGDLVGAETELEQALEIDEDMLTALTLKVKMLLDNGRFNEAVDTARKVQAFYPNMPAGYHMEATAESAKGRHAVAAKAYSMAYKKAPNADRAILSSTHYSRAGDLSAAAVDLKDWLERSPGSLNARLAQAGLLQQSQQLKEAEGQYLKVLEVQPNNIVALNNLAWILHEQGDGRALGYAEKAYQLDSSRPALIDTLGWLLVHNNQSERGIELLQSAVRRAGNDAEFRYHLAAAYEQAGRLEEARREIQIALENRETLSDLEQAQELSRRLSN